MLLTHHNVGDERPTWELILSALIIPFCACGQPVKLILTFFTLRNKWLGRLMMKFIKPHERKYGYFLLKGRIIYIDIYIWNYYSLDEMPIQYYIKNIVGDKYTICHCFWLVLISSNATISFYKA